MAGGRDFNFDAVVRLAIIGIIAIIALIVTGLVAGILALTGGLVTGTITLKSLFYGVATVLFMRLFAKINPISFFYNNILRVPVRAFNNMIESALIRNVSLDNARYLKGFLFLLYAAEALIGIVGIQSLIITPLNVVIAPIIGTTASIIFTGSFAIYNFVKMFSWFTERLVNFNLSILNRRWEPSWTEVIRETRLRNQMQFRRENDLLVQQQLQQQNTVPRGVAQDPSFSSVWHKAMKTKDLKELLIRLQTQYSSSYYGLEFTDEMKATYALNSNNGDDLWKGLPAEKIMEIESNDAYEDLRDPISFQFMRIPVRVKTATFEHKFDLIQLLQCLSQKKENPINRAPIKDLREIEFDVETYNRIRKVVNTVILAERREMIMREIKASPLVWMQASEAVKGHFENGFSTTNLNAENAEDTSARPVLVRRASI